MHSGARTRVTLSAAEVGFATQLDVTALCATRPRNQHLQSARLADVWDAVPHVVAGHLSVLEATALVLIVYRTAMESHVLLSA